MKSIYFVRTTGIQMRTYTFTGYYTVEGKKKAVRVSERQLLELGKREHKLGRYLTEDEFKALLKELKQGKPETRFDDSERDQEYEE